MTRIFDHRNMSVYTVDATPLTRPPVETYRLLFSSGKLIKLRMLTEDIKNDAYGIEGASRYAALKAELVREHGAATQEVQSAWKKGFTDPAQFYICISFPECGEWESTFKASDKNISIQLEGIGAAGRGQIQVTEESVPEYSEAMVLYATIGWITAALLGGAIAVIVYAAIAKVDAALERAWRRKLARQSPEHMSPSR